MNYDAEVDAKRKKLWAEYMNFDANDINLRPTAGEQGETAAMMCRSCYEHAEQDNADGDDGSTEPEPEETA